MAYSIVAEADGEGAGSASTISTSATLTVLAHDTIAVFLHVAQTDLTSDIAASDGTNVYTRRRADYYSAVSGNLAVLVAEDVAAGTYTVTGSWDGSTRTNRLIKAVAIRGLKAASFQAALGNGQSSPGTSTDAVTTGNLTPTAEPACLIGVALASGLQTPSAGSGFTTLTACWQLGTGTNLARPEHKRITSVSAVPATWTSTPTNYPHYSVAAILSEEPPPSILIVPRRRVTVSRRRI